MRNAFANEIVTLAENDPRILLLSADIGNRLFNPYKEKHSNRFFNCGIAEANMIGMASGLALSGHIPICYTITPFLTTRCLEQIRNDICYHNVPVILVGVGSGLCYASDGPTHHSLEDIAILRTLPNMRIVCPADATEVRCALREAIQKPGPLFLRLGKKNEPKVYSAPPEFTLGKAITLQKGKDICLIATGNMVHTAMQVRERLSSTGISAEVVNMHTVKPLDEDCLLEIASRFQVIATIEEHGLIGGLGSSVSEWIADSYHTDIRIIRFGADDRFLSKAGSQLDLRIRFGLSPEQITEKCSTAVFSIRSHFRPRLANGNK